MSDPTTASAETPLLRALDREPPEPRTGGIMTMTRTLVALAIAAYLSGCAQPCPAPRAGTPPHIVAVYQEKLRRMAEMCSALPYDKNAYRLNQVWLVPSPGDKGFKPNFDCYADGEPTVWIDVPKDILP